MKRVVALAALIAALSLTPRVHSRQAPAIEVLPVKGQVFMLAGPSRW
jgi:hypothetical protein